ncbi:acetylornithine deacetylase [Pseudidiomarina salinarum]|uniref:Acetylornithine deacetylase n=1 Tax=Pseudidiomarina salinarum TaxID=435908 RepID=A0A094IW53_9GAMM|nr:acetylornithine deacetylase [Pseudidiomarina salinarum]KFZ30084.1 acetylornithine deacetylase [Pseudidiomarina salinarum]RUO70055.1 acetylornithine deacetylase [Pseudidiomarina salinarum]
MSQLPKFRQMYRELIAIPSISGIGDVPWDTSNQPVVEKIGNWLQTLGFQIAIQELDRQRGKFNMLARYTPEGCTSGGLLLSGHTDTVPWDQGRWTRDPFQLHEDEDKLYGLGTVDMKGFFAFVLETLRDMDLSKLKKPIYVLATADEETSMAGARELGRFENLKPDYAIIGEPTSMTPVIMHKGHLSEAIRVTGKSGHSSDPSAGVNAIEVMHDVISELRELQKDFKTRYTNDEFKIPYPTLNFGSIQGGDAANRICACCELHIDLRPLPGMSMNDLYGLIDKRLDEVNQKYPGAVCLNHLHEPIAGFRCDPNASIVELAKEITGNQATPVNYCTEAGFIQELGCETIVMGPGSIEQAHQPDEFIRLKEVDPALKQLRQMIQRVCM